MIAADLHLDVHKRTKAERVLALIIESGVFYIFSDVHRFPSRKEDDS